MTMTATEHAQQMGRISPAKPTYGYYRQPDGFITVSPITDLEELRYTRKGWTRLTKYGPVEMNDAYAADHPLEALLMAGGVGELCVEQILQTGLYMNPPLVPTCGQRLNQFHKRHNDECFVGAEPMVFPQLAGMTDIGPFACTFCGEERPTVKARDRHEEVMHKDEKSDTRQGQALADGMLRGLQGTAPASSEASSDDSDLRAMVTALSKELAAVKAQKAPTRRRRTVAAK